MTGCCQLFPPSRTATRHPAEPGGPRRTQWPWRSAVAAAYARRMSTDASRAPYTDSAAGAAVKAADRAHVFHSWSAQGLIDPLAVAGAEGAYFWDYDGNRYLDLTSGLVFTNIGYQHPVVVAAIQEQAGKLATFAPAFAVEARSEAARLIAERTPGDLDKIFFTNGGAEAVENAVRMARLHTGRHKVLSAYRSYHGATAAAVVLETIPGTAGIMTPPPGYLAGVREICDRHGIVFVLDEVMAGFGRTGKWFAADHHGVVPDLMTFAKGVNSGYVPLGGVAISAEIAATFDTRPYPGGLTYSGHPLACAAAVATINVMEDEKIVEGAAHLGEHVLAPGLRELAGRHPSVGEVRGLGAFWALELVRDRETREPLVPYNATGEANGPMAAFGAACKKNGLWPFINMNRTHVVPACNITEAEAKEGLAALDTALSVADEYTV